jgi:hypothetical protein
MFKAILVGLAMAGSACPVPTEPVSLPRCSNDPWVVVQGNLTTPLGCDVVAPQVLVIKTTVDIAAACPDHGGIFFKDGGTGYCVDVDY